jgi:tRNA A-37 threonylcarbamoyl transferase component Bud32
VVAVSFTGENLIQTSKKLTNEILGFCRHIADEYQIEAACICGDCVLAELGSGAIIEVLLVVRGFQPKMMNYVKVIDGHPVIVLTVDDGAFEMDADKGFLGEALAKGMILPYKPLINGDYLHAQEIKLKKRLILELLENLVLGFPELSTELHIRPEYFVHETLLSRARVFPLLTSDLRLSLQGENRKENLQNMLSGFIEALKLLEKDGNVAFSDDYVRITRKLADSSKGRKVRFVNLFRPAQRTLFTSLLGVFPNFLKILSQNRDILQRIQESSEKNAEDKRQLELPEDYVYVPTTSGLVPLSDRMDIETFARKVLKVKKDAKVTVEKFGGVLNDVYLVKTMNKSKEEKVVVKSYRDWSNFKWFPLTLWSVGTRTFTVLGRSRLEKEFAINQLLSSNGFAVPKILHVSPNNRLIFMEYVGGRNLGDVIRESANPKKDSRRKKNLKTIKGAGEKFAKVHALNIALGDTKPENIMINKNDEIYLTDFEQASRGGDKVWDVAEFLYYAGHDIPPLTDMRKTESIAEAFIKGYLGAGGNIEVVKKAGTPKYTKVFSVFTFPHIMLAISSLCRRADKMKE